MPPQRIVVGEVRQHEEKDAASCSTCGRARSTVRRLSVLGPEVGRLLSPLMSCASEFIGVGNVISSDLVPSGG
jgi:hypothetical protein